VNSTIPFRPTTTKASRYPVSNLVDLPYGRERLNRSFVSEVIEKKKVFFRFLVEGVKIEIQIHARCRKFASNCRRNGLMPLFLLALDEEILFCDCETSLCCILNSPETSRGSSQALVSVDIGTRTIEEREFKEFYKQREKKGENRGQREGR